MFQIILALMPSKARARVRSGCSELHANESNHPGISFEYCQVDARCSPMVFILQKHPGPLYEAKFMLESLQRAQNFAFLLHL